MQSLRLMWQRNLRWKWLLGHSPVTSSAVKQHLGQSVGGVNAKASQVQPD